MNFLTDKIRPMYFKYLSAAFGSALISSNYGAGYGNRIREILKYALLSAAAFGIVWTILIETVPGLFIRFFMTPTDAIMNIAPSIMRTYGISFLMLPYNIFSTYYFQALMKPASSFIVSVSRGAVISGILIMILPVIATGNAIWWAMPLTELITACYVTYGITTFTKQLANAN